MKIITGKVTNAVLQNIDNQTITMVAIETSKNQSITFPMDTTYTPYIQLGQSMQFALEIHPIVSEIHEPSAGTLEGTFQELPFQDLKSLYGLKEDKEDKEEANYSFVEPSIDTNFESLRFEEYQRSQKEPTDSKGAYPTPEKEAKEVQKEEKTEDKSKEKEMNDTPNIDKKENEPTKIVSPLANNIEFIEEKQPKATDNAFMENNAPLPEVEDEEFEEEDEE
ncbi:hypothetical protein [Enterococcus cecorum]|uniref:hypothetical protein n=1 Tax=Enterococcus cecorum TaxID=44008 RepID=UPI000643BC2C|nr:hypothetical protein [Enterococcus cecorum]KLO74110.1 hypothetical protein AA989_04800 [Enterococcus cecorum]